MVEKVSKSTFLGYPPKIGHFLDWAVLAGKTEYVAFKLLSHFVPNDGVSIIEGYMPLSIQEKVMSVLESRGVFVWLGMRFHRYQRLIGKKDWR